MENIEPMQLLQVLEFFNHLAPAVVADSVSSQSGPRPRIDLYDLDFYCDLATPHLPGIEKNQLRQIIEVLQLEINDIFLHHYKKSPGIRPAKPGL